MGSLDAGGLAQIVGATTPGYHDELGLVLSRLDLLTLCCAWTTGMTVGTLQMIR